VSRDERSQSGAVGSLTTDTVSRYQVKPLFEKLLPLRLEKKPGTKSLDGIL